MRKFLPLFFFIGIGFLFTAGFKPSFAQYRDPQGFFQTRVSASVGQYYLSVSGFASPYASIVLSSSEGMLSSAVADKDGNFYFTKILIKQGLNKICLTTVDFKRIGESEACTNISPANQNIELKNIFLPPTIGLQRKEIRAGSEAVVFGYTMPGATVTIYIDKNQTVQVVADSSGFYTYTIKNVKAGQHTLIASANYNQKDSLPPIKAVVLKSLSMAEQVKVTSKGLLTRIWDFLISTGAIFILLSFTLLLIITFLILKLKPEWWAAVREKLKFGRTAHHDWFLEKQF